MKKPKKQKVAQVVEKVVPPMPVEDVAVSDDSRKKAAAIAAQRGGVASTTLNSDALG